MEAQDRSVEARPCGESGEETTTETSLPLGDHQQKLPSRFQRRQTFWAARFVRVDHPFKPMTKRIGLAFQEHGPCFIQCPRQATQPSHHPPNETMIDDRLVSTGKGGRWPLLRGDRIADQGAVMSHALAIGDAWLLEVLLGSRQQAGSGKSLIRQYESRGGR